MNDSLQIPSADQPARERALDIGISCIVQAPAGSGKTDLLTRRYLKLLATVDEPEEILAITFTKAATAEMRSRILNDLETAARNPFSQDERVILAQAALKHAERRGWRLLEQPERLDIQTIDSLCLRLAHDQPRLARLGGRLQPTEHAAPLYALAARRALANLGSASTELNDALLGFLRLRDNNLADCERLLAEMLATRDQWAHAFLLSGEIDWDEVRVKLERPFRRAIRRVLTEAHGLINAQPVVAEELLQLANYACGNDPEIDLQLLSGLRSVPTPDEALLAHWKCVCNLLLTGGKISGDQDWRKQLNKKHGFPSEGIEAKRRKDRMAKVLDHLKSTPGLLEVLCEIRNLPPPTYSEGQWQTLRHIFTLLRHAVAELRVLFAEQNKVDFIEVGMAAQHVFSEPTERALGVSERIRHLLVDEFQDTSRRQHQLISMLVRAWDEGDGRTCFLVGDPMQSIYMFRQAEVELFHQVQQHGLLFSGHQISCERLELSKNFRSHAGLTGPLNGYFHEIFKSSERPGAAAVSFSPSVAEREGPPSIAIHAAFAPSTSSGKAEAAAGRQREASEVLGIIENHLPQIERAKAVGEEYRVAVLVRAKQHLAELMPLLRQAGIPFRAVELETLGERQEILDLLSLMHALQHPMDRIAWLAVLRAPWCGLTLGDLHLLCGSDARELKYSSMPELIAAHQHLLSEDGRLRLERTYSVLQQAQAARYQQGQSFTIWIERTWRTLGGPQCIDPTSLANTQAFFHMLDAVSADGIDTEFDAELKRLFAQPDPKASERCGVQLMTIHKAKGLGFEVVIVPGLDRKPRPNSSSLVCSLERTLFGDTGPGDTALNEMLVAPIGSKGDTGHPLYKWVQAQKELRESEERKRLLYVACTRARNELHLLGTAVVGKSGLRPGDSHSLLATAWPALESEFVQQQPDESVAPGNLIEFPQPGVLAELAATAHAAPSLMLHRLPLDASRRPVTRQNVAITGRVSTPHLKSSIRFERPEGSRHARIVGTVVHSLLERLSRMMAAQPTAGVETYLPPLRAMAQTMLRALAYQGSALHRAAAEAVEAVEAALSDRVGRWVLGPHADAQSEASWTGWMDGTLRTLRADRIFRAGAEPLSEGHECFWVVDYKTTGRADGPFEAFLSAQRAQYEPQLAAYGHVLRAVHGDATALRLALYYPRLGRFDYWEDASAASLPILLDT